MAFVECFSLNWRSKLFRKPRRLATSLISFQCNLNQQWVLFWRLWICGLCKWIVHVKLIRAMEIYWSIHTLLCKHDTYCAFEHIRNAVIRKFHFKNFLCSNVLSHLYQRHEFACFVCWNNQSYIVMRLCLFKIFIKTQSPFNEMLSFRWIGKVFKKPKLRAINLYGAHDSRYLIRRFPLCVWWIFSI